MIAIAHIFPLLLLVQLEVARSLSIYINSSFSLQYYLCDPEGQRLIKEDTTLVLSTDNYHTLHVKHVCGISNVHNLTLTGSSPLLLARINCSWPPPNSGLAFYNATSIKLANVIITNCGGTLPMEFFRYRTDYFYYDSAQSSTLIFQNSSNIEFSNVSITNYYGFASLFINANGTNVLRNTTVMLSTGVEACTTGYSISCTGSGLVIHYYNTEPAAPIISNFLIDKAFLRGEYNTRPPLTTSEISFSQMFKRHRILASMFGAALTVLYGSGHLEVNVNLSRITVDDSLSLYFGGLAVMYANASIHCHLILYKCNFLMQSLSFGRNYTSAHIGVYIHLGKDYPANTLWSPLAIQDLYLQNKYYDYINNINTNEIQLSSMYVGVGQTDKFLSNYNNFTITIALRNVQYKEGYTGYIYRNPFLKIMTQLSSLKSGYQLVKMVKVILCDCVLKTSSSVFATLDYGKMIFKNLASVSFEGLNAFVNQSGSVIESINSDVHLKGFHTFTGNIANQGSGVYLQGSSLLYIYDTSRSLFINNQASFSGGAIYHEKTDTEIDETLCSIQIVTMPRNKSVIDKLVTFVNNSAQISGNAIYSSNMFDCLQIHTAAPENLTLLYNSVFSFDNIDNGLSPVSGEPVYVQFCDPKRNLEFLQVHPGTDLMFGFRVYDLQMIPTYGQVEVSLHTMNKLHRHHFNPHDVSNLLPLSQRIQTVYGKGCTSLQYTFQSLQLATSFPLQMMFAVVGYTSGTKVAMELHPCPSGFELDGKTHMCNCSAFLVNQGISKCHISSLTVQVPQHIWIGLDRDTMLYASYCPISYCRNELGPINVSTLSLDKLCKGHRSGILCGGCEDGYSKVVGSTDCYRCSEKSPYIIAVYLIGGIGFIVLMYIFKFTIDRGTVGGLYFIIDVFIHRYKYLNTGTVGRVSLFSAGLLRYNWLVPICVLEKMTSVEAAIAEFIFPLYLWMLVGVIVFLSRYSSRIANLAVISSVQVLATLMYIAFGEVISATINTLTPAYLATSDGVHKLTWFWDGSVDYGSNIYHMILVIMSCILLFGFILPFILVGLFGDRLLKNQCIAKYCRPFFNAFSGPYAEGKHHWFGYRLLLITVLKLVIGLEGINTLQLYIYTVLLTMYALVQAFSMPFYNRILNAIDLWFTFLLILASVSTLTFDSSYIVTDVIPFLLLLSSVLIFSYHSFLACYDISCISRRVRLCVGTVSHYYRVVHMRFTTASPRCGYEPIEDVVKIDDECYRDPLNLMET